MEPVSPCTHEIIGDVCLVCCRWKVTFNKTDNPWKIACFPQYCHNSYALILQTAVIACQEDDDDDEDDRCWRGLCITSVPLQLCLTPCPPAHAREYCRLSPHRPVFIATALTSAAASEQQLSDTGARRANVVNGQCNADRIVPVRWSITDENRQRLTRLPQRSESRAAETTSSDSGEKLAELRTAWDILYSRCNNTSHGRRYTGCQYVIRGRRDGSRRAPIATQLTANGRPLVLG